MWIIYSLIALAAIIIVFAIIVFMRPADFRVVRSTSMSAPASAAFAQVNDFHKWDAWSPWAKIDPNCKMTFEGAPAGVGAIQTWDGNNKVGKGRSTITESHPTDLIRIKLEFFRPFKATNVAEFTFKSQGNQIVITWSMSGKNNFLSKAVGMFMDCDKMIGDQFEKGLADLKRVAEANA